jgi:hypothetical protein
MIDAPALHDSGPYDTLRGLFAERESILGWMHHEEGLEHYEGLVQNKDAYRYLLHAHSGSLVLLYNPQGAATWDDAAVVLVYEGQPMVLAKSLREWLGTMHWPEAYSELATAAMMHGLMPAVYKSPPEVVTAEKLADKRASALAEDPELAQVFTELEAAGYPPATDVVSAMWATRQAHPDVAL